MERPAVGTTIPSERMAGRLCTMGGVASVSFVCLAALGCTSLQSAPQSRCEEGWLAAKLQDVEACLPDYPVWGVGPTKPSDLVFNSDGTVTHGLTGLMWEATPTTAKSTWSEAASYCETLNLGGWSDWRMPSLAELSSMVPYRSYEPGDPPIIPHLPAQELWSVTPGHQWPAGTSVMSTHSSALGFETKKAAKASVRCTRRKTTAKQPPQRFSISSPETFRDQATGLSWQRNPELATLGFADAVEFCANSEGNLPETGWRVPTFREVESLLSWSNPGPGVPWGITSGDPSLVFWTSTVSAPAALSDTNADVHYLFDVEFRMVHDGCDTWPGIVCPKVARVLCVK